jgi:O-antigen ligase
MTGARALLLLAGFLTPFSYAGVGVVFFGEVFMALLAPWIILHNSQDRRFWIRPVFGLAFALTATIVGYAVSDLVNQTTFDNIIRGWGRLFFMTATVLFLYGLLYRRPADLWWFCLGMCCGDLLHVLTAEQTAGLWKRGYGIPLTLLAVLFVPALVRRVGAIAASVVFVGLAATHVMLDFRSFSGLSLILGLIIVFKTSDAWAKWRPIRIAMATVAGLAVVAYFYWDSEHLYDIRRQDSNAFRSSAYITAVRAVLERPLSGYGSWSFNPDLQWSFEQTLIERGSQLTARFDAHSQILQAWYEGGLFGTFFFVYLGYHLVRNTRYLVRERSFDRMLLVYMFFLTIGVWDLFMSPFAGSLRLRISIIATIFLMLEQERIQILVLKHRIVVARHALVAN